MFLGISPVVTNWSAASDEFSLILDNNPMAEFAELPEGHEGLLFSNILCGVLRGALEMVRVQGVLICPFEQDDFYCGFETFLPLSEHFSN